MRTVIPVLALLAITPSPPAGAAADEFAAMNNERIGVLRIGSSAAEVTKALGRPTTRSKPVTREADGLHVQLWSWPAQGLALEMASEKKAAPPRVDAITLKAPATLKTSRGIGVGSPVAELERAYGKEKNAEESRPDTMVVGSLYGGVIFKIDGGKVAEIFVGAAAE